MRLSSEVKKEVVTIGIGIVTCSIITIVVFLIIGKFDLSVLLGGIYGGVVSFLNFLFLAFTVQRIADMAEQNLVDDAKKRMQASYSSRQLGMTIAIGIGLFIGSRYGIFHWFPMIIAASYPRLTIFTLSLFNKKYKKKGEMFNGS
ncbi:MAG: ATP synthase subunit I [Clostridiales bacterium]|nr:ATP synthase subunit I [Clostridiales bacterium]